MVVKYLELISGDEKIMIEASNGQATIDMAKKTFKSFIDPDFQNWNLDNPGAATAETLLDVYEMARDATFKQMFTSLNSDLDKLVMTQNQIICFCEKHPAWLCQDEYATFFLIKKDYNAPATNDNLFAVSVFVYPHGLNAEVFSFKFAHSWSADCLRRVVTPQLLSSVA